MVISVALSTQPRVVKPAILATNATWSEIAETVCLSLNVSTASRRLTHFIAFDKDGDQLSTEISSASKFWKLSASDSTILRVFTAAVDTLGGVGGGDRGGDQRNSPLTVISSPDSKIVSQSSPDATTITANSGLSHSPSVAVDMIPPSAKQSIPMVSDQSVPVTVSAIAAVTHEEGKSSSTLMSVCISHARHPRREVSVVLRIDSAWSAISTEISKALSLDPDMTIAYITVFDREDRKFGSPIIASDKFWKNMSYYSHHVFRIYTVAAISETDANVSKGRYSYQAALSNDPENYKTIRYDTIPSMDDIRKSISIFFKVCADIVTHVVFMDSDGDELSGALNADSKLLKFFHHKEVCVRVFTSVPAVVILPRYTFVLEAANGPPLKGLQSVSISRAPSWEELKLEIAEEMKLESLDIVSHVVFIGNQA